MTGLLHATLAAATALALAPASALATPTDIASTHAYISANYAFVRASEAKIGLTQTRVARYSKKIARECRHVGAGSPQGEEGERLSYEVAGALWSVSYGADAAPIRTFARAVGGLRWSNSKLTHDARSYLATLHGLATLRLPDVCGDVRAWGASGFVTVPVRTIRFDRYVESLEARTIPPGLLARYEQPGDRSILARTTSLERKLLDIETSVGYNDWEALLLTLGLNN